LIEKSKSQNEVEEEDVSKRRKKDKKEGNKITGYLNLMK
jgi:hypothetical protein